MKAFKVIYKHGHFIDQETGKRIIPVQGEDYVITGAENSFTLEDMKLTITPSKDSDQKKKWAQKEFETSKYHKLFDAGAQFIFRVGNSKMQKGDESKQYVFLCSLTEDLYLYLLKEKEPKEPKNWRLARCNCKLEKCLLGNLSYFEKLEAESLNQLFTRTVMHFFSNQRSGSANALETFYHYDPSRKVTFDMVSNKFLKQLNQDRIDYIKSNF